MILAMPVSFSRISRTLTMTTNMTRNYGEMKNTPVYPIVLTQMTTNMFHLSKTPNTSRSFPHSGLITGIVTKVTRRVTVVKQDLLTILEHCGVRVSRSLVLCVIFCKSLFVLLSFFFWPLWCLSLRFTDSDYPFGIFKLVLKSSL